MQATTGLRRFNRNHSRLTALIVGIAGLVALASAAYLWNERSAGEQSAGSGSATSIDVRAYHAPSAGEGLVGGLDDLPVAALEAHFVSGAGEGFIGGFGSPVMNSESAPYAPGAGEGIIGGFTSVEPNRPLSRYEEGMGEGRLGGFGQ